MIVEKDKELDAFLQTQNEKKMIRKLIYLDEKGVNEKSYSNYEIDGALFLSPDRSLVIFMQKELEDSLFTRMFLLNGAGLKRFEFVRNFGGEVKIFKVIFD